MLTISKDHILLSGLACNCHLPVIMSLRSTTGYGGHTVVEDPPGDHLETAGAGRRHRSWSENCGVCRIWTSAPPAFCALMKTSSRDASWGRWGSLVCVTNANKIGRRSCPHSGAGCNLPCSPSMSWRFPYWLSCIEPTQESVVQ